jgi:hypothetical protein
MANPTLKFHPLVCRSSLSREAEWIYTDMCVNGGGIIDEPTSGEIRGTRPVSR